MSSSALILRLRAGWPPEEAITLPPQHVTDRKWKWFVATFGETKTMGEWERDGRCKVIGETLLARLKRGIPAEVAITTPPYRLP